MAAWFGWCATPLAAVSIHNLRERKRKYPEAAMRAFFYVFFAPEIRREKIAVWDVVREGFKSTRKLFVKLR
jgi:hypothetical protein